MTVIKLRTLQEAWSALIPKDAKMRFDAFEELVEQHGTYHQFGKFRFMTDQDVLDLIRLTAARNKRPSAPSPNEPGLLVWIGHPYDPECLVFMGWAPLGHELDLLERLKEGAQERLMVLNTVNATPADLELMKQRHKKAWRFGGWYGRTEELVQDMRLLTDDNIMIDDEGYRVEQLQEEAGRESREVENSRV